MFRISDAANFRRTLAGVGLIAAPIAFGAADVLRVAVEGGAAEGAEQLAAIEANISLWGVATVVDMIGVILFVPAFLGLVHLLSRRSVVLGHIGGALALLGVLGWAGHNAGYFGLYGAASTSDIGHAAMAGFFDHALEASPAFGMYVVMFLIGFLFGPLLLGVGLYRARVVPRWKAGLLIGGMVAWMFVGFTPAAANVAAIATVWVLIATAMGAVGLGVLAMPDRDWVMLKSGSPDDRTVGSAEPTPASVSLPAD